MSSVFYDFLLDYPLVHATDFGVGGMKCVGVDRHEDPSWMNFTMRPCANLMQILEAYSVRAEQARQQSFCS
jgi:hypothetical protein